MRLNMSRIGNRTSRKVPRIRILRSWRGYPVGTVIQPPGGARQILLQAKDPLGNKIAEVVDESDDLVVQIDPEPESQSPANFAQRRVANTKKKASDMAEMKEAGVDDERKP
jgi:hypothetical protein